MESQPHPRFEVEREIARGGMGVIYRARDLEDGGRPVALKLLLKRSSTLDARFQEEAELLQQLAHPAIVAHVAHGATPDGAPFLAMEWLEGETLTARLARRGVTVAETVALGLRVAEALTFAHAQGVLHRDIKPDNVFLPSGDASNAKVLDFGIATRDPARDLLTREARVVGTPGYLAPEQARGELKLTPAADWFAFGCILFECLSGRPAFIAQSASALLARVAVAEVPALGLLRPEVPAELARLVALFLARRPADRSASPALCRAVLAAVTPPADDPPMHRTRALAGAALGDAERVPIGVVLVEAHALASAPGAPAPAPQDEALFGATLPAGAERTDLAGGAALLTLRQPGASAIALAAQVAACGLAARAARPDAHVAALLTSCALAAATSEALDAADVLLAARSDGHANAPALWVDATLGALAAATLGAQAEGAVLCVDEQGPRPLMAARDAASPAAIPLQGRRVELQSVGDLCADALAAGRLAVVHVTGVAGVGKTRFCEELLARLARDRSPPRPLAVALSAAEPEGPLKLLGELTRAALGVDAVERAAARGAHVVDWVRAHGIDEPDAVGAALCTWLGAGSSSREPLADDTALARGGRASEAELACDVLARWCAEGPALVVIDDAEHADAGSIAALTRALPAAAGRGLALVVVGRPELGPRWSDLPAERAVALGELPAQLAEKLVASVAGARVPADAVRALGATVGGNPAALVHAARLLLASGTPPPRLALAALARSRLDTLSAGARRVMRAASVFGARFWVEGVRAVLGDEALSAGELKATLESLAREELVQLQPRARIAGAQEYLTRSAEMRDAAWASLPPEERVAACARAAAWLEATGEVDPAALADCWERGGAPERAARWLIVAAARAEAAGEGSAGIAALERAGALALEAETRALARVRLAGTYLAHDRLADAERVADEVAASLPAGSAHWLANLHTLLMTAVRRSDADAVSRWAAAFEGAPRVGECVPVWIRVACALGEHALAVGSLDLARRLCIESEALFRDAPAVPAAVGAALHGLRGSLAAREARLELAMRHFEHAAGFAAAALDVRMAISCRSNAAAAGLLLGLYPTMETWLRGTLKVVRARAMPLRFVLLALGFAQRRLGRLDDANRALAEARAEAEAAGDALALGYALLYTADASMAAGDIPRAGEQAMQCLAIGQTRAAPLAAGACALLAEVYLAAGQPAQARAFAEAGMRVVRALGRIDVFDARLRLACVRALAASGDAAGSRAELLRAAEVIREQAAHTDDATLRSAFLERVEENAATLRMADALAASAS